MSKRISSWWVFQTTADIEVLKGFKGTLDSLSLHCEDRTVPPEFVAECKALGWEVIQLVDYRSGPYSTPEEVAATADRMVDINRRLGFDGIDLDYEFEPPAMRANYTSLVEEVGRRLKAEGKKLSICVGYYPHTHQNPPDHGFIDAEAIGRLCDEVRVMCYDQYFGPAKGQEPFDRLDCQGIGPSSTQPWARKVMEHWLQYVDREKLVMGLPAYSNDYTVTPGGGGRHVYSSLPPANNWLSDKSWLWYDKINVYRYYDEKGAPHLFYASDKDSTLAHLETASDLGISTISFWQARSVSPDMWSAVREWRKARSETAKSEGSATSAPTTQS